MRDFYIRLAVFLSFFLFTSIASTLLASDINEFARLSNIKDALKAGDCQRYGGTNKGIPQNPIQTLEKYGESLGGYRNVRRYNGDIYIVYSAPKSGFMNYLAGGIVREIVICKFKG